MFKATEARRGLGVVARKRILTVRQARNLRPVAKERARHSKFKPGDIVFYKGITWGNCLVFEVYETKPNRTAILWGRRGRGGMFSGVLSEAVAEKPEKD